MHLENSAAEESVGEAGGEKLDVPGQGGKKSGKRKHRKQQDVGVPSLHTMCFLRRV